MSTDAAEQVGHMPTSAFTCMRFERHGDVLKVVIDNPASELNSVDANLHDDFVRLFSSLREERLARAVLLTGSKRAFCAGGDFTWFPTLDTVAKLDHLRRDGKQLIWDLLDVELPIVCALNGHAMGLGASISLLCDTIFMADHARIGDPHVRVGIVAGDGGVAIWPLVLGPALAKRFLMTGDALTAAEAERLGLVTHVVPSAELADASMAFAQRLASGATLAVKYTKMAVNKLVKDALNTAFDSSMGHELVTFMSEDHKEAMAAFAERRDPRFTGR
jgi:enoyl-CoA hydratase